VTATFNDLVRRARDEAQDFSDIPRAELIAATRRHVEEAWNAAREKHQQGASGANVLLALTQAADETVKGIVEFGLAPLPRRRQLMTRVAVCALGGYGRSELSPKSDLDICLLFEGQLDDDLSALNSFLVPFLWDIGFKAGYAIHTVAEAHDLARRDPEVFTTYAQGRLITGANTTFSRLKLMLAGLRDREIGAQVLAMLRRREHPAELHESYRDLYSPEPNVKESLGGLRDYHAAMWLIMLRHGQLTLDDLARLGYLSADEHLDVAEGLDFLWRVRNELHFHTNKSENTLTFALQRHVAQALGYGGQTQGAIERLMQDYYAAARRVRGFLRFAERICQHDVVVEAAEPGGEESTGALEVRDGKLFAGLNDPNWYAEYPPRLMEIYWSSARRRAPLSATTEQAVRDHLYLVNEAFQKSDVVRRFFSAICGRPLQAGSILRQMHTTGLLGAYLPEVAAVGGIVRYEDFHSYPVDEHTLRAMEAIAAIPDLGGTVGNFLQRTLEHVRDPHVLMLAILFHDLGKASGEEHVEEGVKLVQDIAARTGLPDDDAERIAFLVRHHMLMTHTSMYRDIDDPELVTQFAETMMSVERLRELLLLSYADLSAVGPNVWTEWKGALLVKLYLRAERVLQGQASAQVEDYCKLPKALDVFAQAPVSRPEAEEYLRGLGERYFFAYGPRTIVRHLECTLQARESGLGLLCEPHEDTGTSEVVICTRDRHGLFASIAGSFASQLLDIKSAALFTTPDGWVVDCFTVADAATRGPLSEAQVEDLHRVLRAVLIEQDNVQPYVDQSRRRLFALLQPHIPVRTGIHFDNAASRTDTVIDIEAGDRTGLLYDMVRALTDLGVDFMSARIVTDARRARDAFYVRMNGHKIENESQQVDIREGLAQAIAPLANAETARSN